MNLVLTVIQTVAPVFLLALVGYVWVRAGFEYRVEFVTRLAMTLSVPCLIFVALMRAQVDPAALTTLSLASLAAYAAVTAVFWALLSLLRLERRTYLSPLIFGNTGNIGLPLAMFAFGEAGLGYAVVVFAVMAILSFTVGVWLVSDKGSPGRVLREPMVGATVLGAIFLWQGWQTPVWLTNTLQLCGQMAIPLMLITLGVAVARLHPSGFLRPLLLSLVKVAVCTGVAWGFGRWFGLAPVPFAILVLQVASPVAVTSYLIAEKYKADPDAVAGLVVLSTLVSVLSIPLTLAFLI
ncbi:MAG: AEC family transporter [Pseudomonadota bacterium]